MSSLYKRERTPYWWWTTYFNGKKLYLSTKMTNKKSAEKVRQHWDLKLMLGELDFIGKDYTSNKPVQEFMNEYLIFVSNRKSKKALQTAKGVLNRFGAFLRDQNVNFISEINVKLLNQYLDSLVKKGFNGSKEVKVSVAPNTKKNHLNEVSLMLEQAVNQDLIGSNPAKKATLPKLIKSDRHRLLDPVDLQIIFENAGGWKLYFEFLYRTGMRAGDVCLLKYENIDWGKKMVTANIRKSKKTYKFPLSDTLFKQLESSKSPETPLFPTLYSESEQTLNGKLKKPRKYMQKLLEVNGRSHATLHSFRHTFNNTLRDLGLSMEDRNILMAQASSEVNKIYTHPNIELARKWINRIPSYDDHIKN